MCQRGDVPKQRLKPIAVVMALSVLWACKPDKPMAYEDAQLAVRARFPGPARAARYVEKTPYGEVEWFGASYAKQGSGGAAFHVQVGNLPAGTQGGTTEDAVLATFEAWLKSRYGAIQRTDIPHGFRYTAPSTPQRVLHGTVIMMRARLHHAQAAGEANDDVSLKQFVDSFEVTKEGVGAVRPTP